MAPEDHNLLRVRGGEGDLTRSGEDQWGAQPVIGWQNRFLANDAQGPIRVSTVNVSPCGIPGFLLFTP